MPKISNVENISLSRDSESDLSVMTGNQLSLTKSLKGAAARTSIKCNKLSIDMVSEDNSINNPSSSLLP